MAATKPSFFSAVTVPALYILLVISVAIALFALDIPLYNAIKAANVQTTPLGNSPAAQTEFASIYLLISVAVVFGLAATFTRKKLSDKRWALVAIAFGLMLIFMAQAVLWYISGWVVILVVLSIWVLFYLSVTGKLPDVAGLPFVALFTASAGVLLVLVMPPITLIVLPIAFSMWDIYAVFKGPMMKVATGIPPKMRRLFMLKAGVRGIGFGDLMFYSMVTAFGYSLSISCGVLGIMGVMTGVLVTFWLLSGGQHKGLPGLPLPMLFGFCGIGLALII